MLKFHFTWLLMALAIGCTWAQDDATLQGKRLRPNPYRLSWAADGSVLGVSAGLGVATMLAKKEVEPYTVAELNALNRNDIWAFDRSATYNYSSSANLASDILSFSSWGTPLLLLADKKIRPDFGKILVMAGETYALNLAATHFTKALTVRARPYAYNADVPLEDRQTVSARQSFFSGHTSSAACMTFFTAKVFHDYNKTSRAVPYVWTAAALVPAATGFFRVQAGKHYWSDVIVGYAVGAIIGVGVPELHRIFNKSMKKQQPTTFVY